MEESIDNRSSMGGLIISDRTGDNRMRGKNLLDDRPDIAERWNHFRNGAFTPSLAKMNTKGSVWWICPEGHEAEYPFRRMVDNNGELCKTCKDLTSGKLGQKALQDSQTSSEQYQPEKVSKESWDYIYCKDESDSIAVMNPEVASRWHPTMNGPRTPENHSAYAHTWVWLVCDKGHAQLFKLHGAKDSFVSCEDCARSLQTVENELVKTRWDSEKNTISPDFVVYTDQENLFWWKCNMGHSFKQTVFKMRSLKHPCDECLKTSEKNFVVSAPNIARQWHPEKNGELRPEDFTRGSEIKVWWQCPECHHEWQAPIKNRVINGTRCAQCTKVRKKGALDEKHPDVFANLDIEKTKLKGVNPKVLGHTSEGIVSWKCSADASHVWEMSPAKLLRSGVLCPMCNSKINME